MTVRHPKRNRCSWRMRGPHDGWGLPAVSPVPLRQRMPAGFTAGHGHAGIAIPPSTPAPLPAPTAPRCYPRLLPQAPA